MRKPRAKKAPAPLVAVPQAMPRVLAGGPALGAAAAAMDDVSGWKAWARVRALRQAQRLPPGWLPRVGATLDDVILPPGALAAYVRFARGHVYGGRGAPRGLDDMLRILDAMAAPALAAPPEAHVPEPPWRPRPRGEGEQRAWVCTLWGDVAQGGPAYGDVLDACAAHIWVPPLTLHKALLDLERRVMTAEAAAGLEMGRHNESGPPPGA